MSLHSYLFYNYHCLYLKMIVPIYSDTHHFLIFGNLEYTGGKYSNY